MTEVRELIDAVVSFGAAIHLDGGRLILMPASKVPAELKTRLRECKPELLAYLSRQSYDVQDSWAWIEERAAILEYDAGLPRNVADARAFTQWFERFVGSDKP